MRRTNHIITKLVIILIILLALTGIMLNCKYKPLQKKTQSVVFQAIDVAHTGQAVTSTSSVIKYYPEGKLETQVPTAITLLLPENEKVDGGTTISYNNAAKCFTISPGIKGMAVWVNPKTLEYRFDETPTPDTMYKIQVTCIPLDEKQNKKIELPVFYFTTPPLIILSGYATQWTLNQIEALVRWNYPLDSARLGEFIEVIGNKNQNVRVKSATRHSNDEQAVVITFNNIVSSYKIKFKEGLPLKNNKGTLSSALLFNLPMPGTVNIIIQRLSVTEGDDYYSIKVLCQTAGHGNCTFDATKIRGYINVKPAVKYKIVASYEGFELYGDFIPGNTYEVEIAAGLRTLKDAELKNTFTQSVQVPQPTAKLSFAIQGMYLGKKGKAQLPLRVRSFKNMYVSVWRLPVRNLPLWFSDKGEQPSRFRELAEPVTQNKLIEVNADTKNRLFWLDLNSILNTNEEGVYQISAEPADGNQSHQDYNDYDNYEGKRYYENSKSSRNRVNVIISDISIITKTSSSSLYTWVVNSSTLAPINNASVELWSSKNVSMGTCITDSDGFCSIGYPVERERAPYLLTATKDEEFSFIYFDNSTLQTNNFDVSGVQVPANNYLGYYYPERDLYRPGETVHFAFILREYGTYQGMKLPVIVTINDSRGKEWISLHATTDDAGLAEFKVPTEVSSPTGKYSLRFMVADAIVADGYFFLEDFVPQRIKVSLHPDKLEYSAGEEIKADIQADYLFGTPAAGQSYDLMCEMQEIRFSPPSFSEYTFGVFEEQKPAQSLPPEKGELDQHGYAEVSCPPGDISKYKSPIRLSMTTHVTEAGSGRTSNATTSVLIHPAPYYIGLQSPTANIQPGTEVDIAGVFVNKQGTLLSTIKQARYRIYRMEYNHVQIYDANQEKFSWQWNWMHIPYTEVTEVKVNNGKFSLNFKPMDYWSNYLVEVTDKDNLTQSSIMVYSWSYYYNEKKISTPEMLKIKLDKSTVDYNTEVTASALLPFEGKILWTVEQDDIIMHKLDDARGETARYSFDVPEKTNTVYVSALLITSNEKYSVRRAFGVQRLRIRPSAHILKVEINAPDTVKPNTDVEITIKAAEHFEGTVAVVDEGILQITQFKTPQPLNSIFADLALNTRTAETFGWLIRKDTFPSPGGDTAAKIGETPSFVRIVSYWSGIIKSNENGVASVKIHVPEYQGKLRVMISAANTMRIGSTEKNIQVASDVSVMPTMPRFVHTNDRLNIPIAFINNAKVKTSTSLSITMSGATLLNEFPKTIELKPHKSAVTILPIKVTTDIEPLIINILAKTGKESYKEKFTIYARPDKPYGTEMNFIELKQGKNEFTNYLNQWKPNREKVQMIVTPLPSLGRLKHMSYLIRYPYGCVEQTSSSLFPLLRMQEILNILDPEIAEKAALNEKVYSGIHRLLSMQNISGGFGYWPGDSESAVWSSVYATFVLLEANHAGYIVPQNALNSATNFLSSYAKKYPFSYYVLAIGDNLNERNINDLQILANRPDLSSEDLLFVAGALSEVGKTTLAQQVLAKALLVQPANSRNLTDDFYSNLRELALRLYFSEKIKPGSTDNEILMRSLFSRLDKESWNYSTQELAWSIMALSSRIHNVQYSKTVTAKAYLDGKELHSNSTKLGMQWSFEIDKKPTQDMYIDVNSDGKVYLLTEIKGFKRNAQYKYYSSGISLETQYYNLEGKVISDAQQKDIIIIELSINNTTGKTLENAAISDYLPAGFEIENPRLAVQNLPAWVDQSRLMNWDYVDYRDERIDIFGTLNTGITRFYYVARATIIGDYFLPPTEAVVMYEPEISARTTSSHIKVLPP